MDRKELKILKNILIKEKERIMKSISQLEENTQRTSRGSASTGPGVPTHIAELGTDTFEKDLDINLTSSEVVLLQMIEESLKKIENRKYGICESCNKPIPKARLRAVPYAKYCIKCQKQQEGKG
ncbi:MAG TPA: TraR/DksA C4-type zinc finger protein [Candidatus Ratteibacteria bacterium]|uniref:General stress protein 16O n=1 Tax=candidate division TA06 bacterium ADurb.Bin131 TaxID=1852827 RepID=A0A1V6C631_UNCT6|nr:MAG: General stress protein 16O [candidate division TA06 bacterium ADurb.Bin131]HOC02573.1 TraR/DksA C4-type zinc finger protein [bacterium]HRS06499.1 TraR/DksA C4-type zinc finger protein [Candidatus Ratteibacteria bacterium]HON06151.1 TraR/DksA C4-type zinc finger protein [bacterium]HPC29393.1 TraR/DksA C4-type zinc finger protein [bacterium]